MSNAEKIDQSVQELIRIVSGSKRSVPYKFSARVVPAIMACAEHRDDITPDIRRQIDDLARRIELLEQKRKGRSTKPNK
jgi:hypothetical protein